MPEGVAVGVRVGGSVSVGSTVSVGSPVPVTVAVASAVDVAVASPVAVAVGSTVDVAVGSPVWVTVAVGVATTVPVIVTVAVDVASTVPVAVAVGVDATEPVAVAVGLGADGHAFDRHLAVAVAIELRTRVEALLVQCDVHAAHQLVDGDLKVTVAVAGARLRRRVGGPRHQPHGECDGQGKAGGDAGHVRHEREILDEFAARPPAPIRT
jgi:hypothetical protein